MKHNLRYINMSRYLNFYESCQIDEQIILLESQQGKNLNGNIFYLLKELLTNKDYANYKIYLSLEKKFKNDFLSLLNHYNLKPNLAYIGSVKYLKLLSSAKYLITDTSFMTSFIKKDDQILLNVWHGTPLKTLGKKDNSGLHSLGNVQKNFFVADYLLYPNNYMKEHMIEDYMLENICNAKCLITGYPRNEIFFTPKNTNILKEMKIEEKQIIGYMPTWRGSVGKVRVYEDTIHIMHYLFEIDKRLNDDQIMLVNLHPFVQNDIEFQKFKHILPFPKDYETYEVLNLCDVLVTDYSSVFFDYAVTRNKIILFAYDLEEYLEDRGLYVSLDSLPFPIVDNVRDLVSEINTPKNYNDSDFINTYCYKDNQNASAQLLRLVLKNEINHIDIYDIPNNGKENVLIYSGNLAKNGITTALFNLLNQIDITKYNYFITFTARKVAPYKMVLRNLPEGVQYISTMGKMNASVFQKICMRCFRRTKYEYDLNKKMLDKLYQYEIKRCYGNIKFSHIIQYSGYEYKRQLMFGRFNSDRIIFVHNNMVQEIKVRNAQNPNALRYAYNYYDKVVMVTEDMREPTLQFCNNENKLCVVNNLIDYKTIIEKSKEELQYDKNTVSNVSLEELKHIFNSSDKVFVSIGRFSPEKGHERLLNAFDNLWKSNHNIYLLIIGGHGVLYKSTLEYAMSLESAEHIIIIKSLTNPYPFLKQCDYFVLSSYHEGFGLVLVEADILGLPVMSTDILGPKGFLEEHHGLLVPDSEEGLLIGMRKMLSGDVKVMNVDYEQYNKTAVTKFENLLK